MQKKKIVYAYNKNYISNYSLDHVMGILKDGILTLKWEPANLSATPAVEETETILLTGNGVRMLA